MEHGNENRRIRLGISYYLRPVCGEYYEHDKKKRNKTGLSGTLHRHEGDKKCRYSKTGRNKDKKKGKINVHKLDVAFIM